MKMYTGDLKPDLEILLKNDKGDFDITDAVAIRIIGVSKDAILFDRAPTSTEVIAATGSTGITSLLTMEWQPADTADVAKITGEVEVMWPGNKPQTIAWSNVEIKLDLDHA